MPYVVKFSAYLDQNGLPTGGLRHAKMFETETLAEAAAAVVGGTVSEVKSVKIMSNKATKKKTEEKPLKKQSKPKSNQAWMKGAKNEVYQLQRPACCLVKR